MISGGQLDEFVRNEVQSYENGRRFTTLPSRAHPRAECRAVRGLLMVRMLGFVRERLGGSQSTDDEDAQHEETGQGTLNHAVRHNPYHTRTGAAMVLEWTARSQGGRRRGKLPSSR